MLQKLWCKNHARWFLHQFLDRFALFRRVSAILCVTMAHVTILKAFKSLRFQLVVLLLLPLALFGATAVWFTWEGVESLVEKRLQKEIELVARALRVPVEQALQRGQVDSIRRSLDAVFEIGRVYGAYVYDSDGKRIAAAGEARPGLPEQMAAWNSLKQVRKPGATPTFRVRPCFPILCP